MFDIYLTKGCISLPKSIDATNTNLTEKLLMSSPGFLGLNLPMTEAKSLLKTLREGEAKALGQIVDVKYRDNPAQITLEEASLIAENVLRQMQTSQYADLHFGEIIRAPALDTLMYYTFVSLAKEWQDAGLIPGAIFASIDKLDGHVWSDEENLELDASR